MSRHLHINNNWKRGWKSRNRKVSTSKPLNVYSQCDKCCVFCIDLDICQVREWCTIEWNIKAHRKQQPCPVHTHGQNKFELLQNWHNIYKADTKKVIEKCRHFVSATPTGIDSQPNNKVILFITFPSFLYCCLPFCLSAKKEKKMNIWFSICLCWFTRINRVFDWYASNKKYAAIWVSLHKNGIAYSAKYLCYTMVVRALKKSTIFDLLSRSVFQI